ncbi:glycoside hydrolase family 19 protein [Actinoplanes sp. NPDC051343]|uniref:glycoside hydrolase family 19 protein n=1 Tax=Actinoplanes sp. NPDC051343 TaxID=3363906 RepID=UPI00378759BE
MHKIGLAAVVAVTVAASLVPATVASAAPAVLASSGIVSHDIRNADGSWRGLSAVPAPGGTGAQGSKAAVAVLNDGAVLVVDIGPDGVLYHQVRRADGTWSGFQGVPAPGNAAARGSEVAAAGLPDGSVLLADVGPDGAVYYQLRRPDGSWSGFKTVPAPGNAAAKGSKVAVAGLPDGSAFLADIGPDGALYYQIRRPNDTWTGFQVVPAPGNATARGSELAAAGLRDGSVLLADVGPDGVVYYQLRRPDGSWSGFKAVPAPGNAAAKGSKVTVAGLPDGSALLADIGPDGVVYHQVRRPNDTWTGFQTVPGANNAPAHATEITAVGLADSTVQLVIVDRPPGITVSIEDLRAIFGSTYDTQVVRDGLPSLNAEMQRGGITTPPRVAAFLATVRNESGFRYNATETSDPSTYRGRGYLQLTGVDNYRAAGENLGHDLVNNPDDAATLAWSAPVARWYWTVARPLNADADALDMGLVSRDIGYAWSAAEDNARCADFKAVLQYYTGSVPAGINCIRPGH